MGRAHYGPPWALLGRALEGFHLPLWAGPLWARLGPCGPGPCGPPGPLWAWRYGPGPLWSSLGPYGPGPCGPPVPLWAGRALVGSLGPLWAGLLWAPWVLMGRALMGRTHYGPPWALPGPALMGWALMAPGRLYMYIIVDRGWCISIMFIFTSFGLCFFTHLFPKWS